MANCGLSSGYKISCRDNTGGVKRIWLADYDINATYTYGTGSAEGSITGASHSSTWYEIEQSAEQAEYNEDAVISDNGSIYYQQNLTLRIPKNDVDTRNLLLVLTQGTVQGVVEDQRGIKWYLGQVNFLQASEASKNTGQAFDDFNGLEITLTAKEPLPSYVFTDSAFNQLSVGS